MADLAPSTPPDLAYGSERLTSAGEDGVDINALHAELEDDPLYDDADDYSLGSDAGGFDAHSDIDGAGGWVGDHHGAAELGGGGDLVDVNQEALLMDEDMDPETHSGELDSRPLSPLDLVQPDSPPASRWEDPVRGDAAHAGDTRPGSGYTDEGFEVEGSVERVQPKPRPAGMEAGWQQEREMDAVPPVPALPSLPSPPAIERQGSAIGIMSLPVETHEARELQQEAEPVAPPSSPPPHGDSPDSTREEAPVHVTPALAEAVGEAPFGGSPSAGSSPRGYLGEVFTLDRLGAGARKSAAPRSETATGGSGGGGAEKPSQLRQPSAAAAAAPADDIDALFARLEVSQAPPPQATGKAAKRQGDGGEKGRKKPSVADEIKGVVDEMERDAALNEQHAKQTGAARARRRVDSAHAVDGSPKPRSRSVVRQRLSGAASDGSPEQRGRRAHSSGLPAREEAREKGWTFKNSSPAGKVKMKDVEVSKPSDEEIRQRRKWAAEKARLQKEQEAKAAVRAKRAEERARREKEARELQIKEKLQARAQARAATKEQQQGGKTKGQAAQKVKPLYQRLEEKAAQRAAREEAEKMDKYNRELGEARRRKTTAIIQESKATYASAHLKDRHRDEMALVLPELMHSPSSKGSPKFFSSHDTPERTSPHTLNLSPNKTRFPKVHGASPAEPPPRPPRHPDDQGFLGMGDLPMPVGAPPPHLMFYAPGQAEMGGHHAIDPYATQEGAPFDIVPYGEMPQALPPIEESPEEMERRSQLLALEAAAASLPGKDGRGDLLKDAATSVSGSIRFDGAEKEPSRSFRPQLTDVLAFNIMISAPTRVRPARLLDETLTLEELAAAMPPLPSEEDTLPGSLRSKHGEAGQSPIAVHLSIDDRRRIFVGDTRTPAEILADASAKVNPPSAAPERPQGPSGREPIAIDGGADESASLQACNDRLSGLATVDMEVGSMTRGRGMEMVIEAVDDGLWGSPGPMLDGLRPAPRRGLQGSSRLSIDDTAAEAMDDEFAAADERLVYRFSTTPESEQAIDANEAAQAEMKAILTASFIPAAAQPDNQASDDASQPRSTRSSRGSSRTRKAVSNRTCDKTASAQDEGGSPGPQQTSGVSESASVNNDDTALRCIDTKLGESPGSRESAQSRNSASSRVDRDLPVESSIPHVSKQKNGNDDTGSANAVSEPAAANTVDVNSTPGSSRESARSKLASLKNRRGGRSAGSSKASSRRTSVTGEVEVAATGSAAPSTPQKKGLDRLRSQKEERRVSAITGDASSPADVGKTHTGLAALRRLSSSRRNSMTSQRAPSEAYAASDAAAAVEGSASSMTKLKQPSRRVSSTGSRRTSDAPSTSSKTGLATQGSGKVWRVSDATAPPEPAVGTLARKISRLTSQRRINGTTSTAGAAAVVVQAQAQRSLSKQRLGGSSGRRVSDVDATAAADASVAYNPTTTPSSALPEADGVFEADSEPAAKAPATEASVVEPLLDAIDEEDGVTSFPLDADIGASLDESVSRPRPDGGVRMSKALSSAEFPHLPAEPEGEPFEAAQPEAELEVPVKRRVSARNGLEDADGSVLMGSPLNMTNDGITPRTSDYQPSGLAQGSGPLESSYQDADGFETAAASEMLAGGAPAAAEVDDGVFGNGPTAAALPQPAGYRGSSALGSDVEIDFGSMVGPGSSAGRCDATMENVSPAGAEGGAGGTNRIAAPVQPAAESGGYSGEEFDDYEDDFEDDA